MVRDAVKKPASADAPTPGSFKAVEAAQAEGSAE